MEEKEKKPGFFKRLVSGLTKTRDNIVSGIDSLFSGFSHIDDDFYEELEEILIMGDLGVRATESIIEDLQRKVKEHHADRVHQVGQALEREIFALHGNDQGICRAEGVDR